MSGLDQPAVPVPEHHAPGPMGPQRRTRWLLIVAAAAASAMGGALAFSAFGPSARSAQQSDASHAQHHQLEASTQPISQQELASKYGIKLTLVGVTAAGGLVDLRFKITDAKKSRKLFNDPSVMPAVVAEPTGTVLQPPHGGHHAHVTPADGASYFVLIGNAGGVVQRGVPVSVVFNTVRVEHILAET